MIVHDALVYQEILDHSGSRTNTLLRLHYHLKLRLFPIPQQSIRSVASISTANNTIHSSSGLISLTPNGSMVQLIGLRDSFLQILNSRFRGFLLRKLCSHSIKRFSRIKVSYSIHYWFKQSIIDDKYHSSLCISSDLIFAARKFTFLI